MRVPPRKSPEDTARARKINVARADAPASAVATYCDARELRPIAVTIPRATVMPGRRPASHRATTSNTNTMRPSLTIRALLVCMLMFPLHALAAPAATPDAPPATGKCEAKEGGYWKPATIKQHDGDLYLVM